MEVVTKRVSKMSDVESVMREAAAEGKGVLLVVDEVDTDDQAMSVAATMVKCLATKDDVAKDHVLGQRLNSAALLGDSVSDSRE
jgi:hypothetical protein